MGEEVHRLKPFAGDFTCTLKDINSIYSLVSTIERFTILPGLKLNWEKSLFIVLGSWRHKNENILNIEIAYNSFNMLGIHIERKEEQDKDNFYDKLVKLKNKLKKWSQRNLSWYGRILISKTYGISNFINSLSLMDAEQIILKTSQSELNNFIWRYKPAKVKHLTITNTTEEADLGNIDIESQTKALRIPWLNHILLSKG